jgi:hypothetical protein
VRGEERRASNGGVRVRKEGRQLAITPFFVFFVPFVVQTGQLRNHKKHKRHKKRW